MSLTSAELSSYVCNQINTFFPDKDKAENSLIMPYLELTLERLYFCFSKICSKYYNNNGEISFNNRNSDHWATFLYFLSNTIFSEKNAYPFLCEKLFLLNKLMNGCDIYFEIKLPDIFLLVHPVGAVLGRAKYSDYLVIYQQVNIGSSSGKSPVLGEYLTLRPGSRVLGGCIIGNNCELGANSLLIDSNLDSNTLYVGNPKQKYTYTRESRNPIWILEATIENVTNLSKEF